MSDGLSGVGQMVSDLNKSLNAAIANVKAQQEAATASASSDVKSYEKTVRKSSADSRMFATDIGVLSKNVSRLNVVSTLNANDPVDFYKFRVTTKGEATMGQVGDEGVQLQVMSKTGQVVADSNKSAGKAYDSFRSLQRGELTLDRGDYTLRVSREKGESAKDPKNYAVQFSMGNTYSQDYDTVAKAPKKGDSPFQMTEAQQQMLDGLNQAISSMNSIPTGQTGTQKLMGSFSLFV
ncbi:hypothetical protein ACIU1J_15915 [Azospirillum doebereinerae]|uniref:hypothetical protein n=1 Tax=Azospirillum doebereinerae TaxID=92933 RepID=UPI001EE5795C|nr:hypothetical protein [Azospirillum doebereinerae]MCG5238562.1 hypothetical protein [Azospirillum doebereinerae]